MWRGILVTVVVLTLGSRLGALAQVDSVVTFDSSQFGWSWGFPPWEWIEPTGGNPGAYLHGDLCCQYFPIASNTSTFTADYQQAGLASLGIDLIMVEGYQQPVVLMLLTDNDTPQGGDDYGAFVFGPDAMVPGAGWLSRDFIVPAQETTLPPGWSMWRTDVDRWAELMQDVDEVRFLLGDPTMGHMETDWIVGMDNVRFSQYEPGRVPPDMVVGRGALGSVGIAWTPPRGCGYPEDYAIYEGEIGDWDSHVPVVCSDAAGDRAEQVFPSPGNRYYLVVPLGSDTEGSYGLDSNGEQRPPGAIVTCRAGRSFVCL